MSRAREHWNCHHLGIHGPLGNSPTSSTQKVYAGIIEPGGNNHSAGTLTLAGGLNLNLNQTVSGGSPLASLYLAIDLSDPFGNGAQSMLAFPNTGTASVLNITKLIEVHFYQTGSTGAPMP